MLTPLGSALYARALSKKAHRGQLYGSEDYFSYHVTGVARNVAKIVPSAANDRGLCMAVAWLHDVVEDTPVTLKMLEHLGFPPEVVNAVDAITKRPGEDYETYLERLSGNPTAVIVKKADVAFNLSESVLSGSTKRIDKYARVASLLAS